MSARILPFKRPAPKEAPAIPPPMLMSFEEGSYATFRGTKEQLLAWGVVEDRHFPVGRKRCAHNKGGPWVRAVKGGLFSVNMNAGSNELELASEINAAIRRVLNSSSDEAQHTTRLFVAISAWRSYTLFKRIPGYDAGLFEPMDQALDAFRAAAAAFVMYQKPQTAERLPPDETEPEHAQ
jgi:hypothetical protein